MSRGREGVCEGGSGVSERVNELPVKLCRG